MSVVLVATNDSPACRRAIDLVPQVVGPEAPLVVAMVLPGRRIIPEPDQELSAVRSAARRIAVASAVATLDRACHELGSTARPLLLGGDPATSLCAAAVRRRAGAIVVGSLGPGPVARMLRGSVGHALARDAPCPVIELGR